MSIEVFRAVFIGRRTFSCYWAKEDKTTGMVWLKKPNRYVPLMYTWTVAFGNLSEEMRRRYTERKLLDMTEGVKDQIPVRVYPFDPDTLEVNYDNLNVESQRLISSLEHHNDLLINERNDARIYNKRTGDRDAIKEFVKDEWDHYHEDLKPPYDPQAAAFKAILNKAQRPGGPRQ